MSQQNQNPNIRDEIVATRKRKISEKGHSLGISVPVVRRLPQVPFGTNPFLICEVKRRSPSKGDIAPKINAVEQAETYIKQGVKHISVLTETDYFGGSLQDLIDIKEAFPKVAVLRKDFLLDEEDIYISYRAGADAVLLIVAILDEDKLRRLYDLAQKLNMAVLLEVHDEADCQKVASLKPAITGINCRNLATFQLDLIIPLALKKSITWPTKLVFESGIKNLEQGVLALSSGFEGLLVGESVLKKPALINELLGIYPTQNPTTKIISRVLEEHKATQASTRQNTPQESTPKEFKDDEDKQTNPKYQNASDTLTRLHSLLKRNFWEKLFQLQKANRPLIKICGLTNREDAELCAELGADVLGFVFAPSKRQAPAELLYQLKGLNKLKVAVVVTTAEERASQCLAEPVRTLWEEGLIDALQFHGVEEPEGCFKLAYPYYKVLRLKTSQDAVRMQDFYCPRILVDTFSEQAHGGTGQNLAPELIRAAQKQGPLWLAGGISPENVREIIATYQPELIDVSSQLEQNPGKKDPQKLKLFFSRLS